MHLCIKLRKLKGIYIAKEMYYYFVDMNIREKYKDHYGNKYIVWRLK